MTQRCPAGGTGVKGRQWRARRQRHQLGRGVHDLHLLDDGGSVAGQEELSEVVNYHLVHPVGSDGGARDGRELLARLDVFQDRLVHAREVLVPILQQVRQPHTSRSFQELGHFCLC